MHSLKKQPDGRTRGHFANTQGQELVFQPKYRGCGRLKPEVACWFPNSRQLYYTWGASTQAVLMQKVV